MHMAQNNFRSCYCIKMNANLVFAFLDDFLEISQPVLAGAMFGEGPVSQIHQYKSHLLSLCLFGCDERRNLTNVFTLETTLQ